MAGRSQASSSGTSTLSDSNPALWLPLLVLRFSTGRFQRLEYKCPFGVSKRHWHSRLGVSGHRLYWGEGAIGSTDVGSGFGSTPSCDRITARSTRFCSSRMLPGQEYDEKAAIVSAGMWWICLPMRRLKISTKCSTSAGISSRRSRRDGNEIGKTLSR